ncbi:MAG: winged helix-turn-helix transcriptional regulator [Maritimibacter sp.]|jgi:DNA-binding MarR family transcriptional regulator|uniref:MarR family winged helix-turn-helix transcriptional regulator n=2 Tax=unclassified Maritimibacter TaxID=2635563 RepID=UPI000C0911E4|nr:MarR family winged helix-turn-helix transcriptional regulator [Maritimibacter sp.]MAM61380.1 MarR family transcriptional regulator [Maritimibacter sp.]MBL6430276.1 winged helix-turn-helix transcriptional regulator [Maritimibacter sp.]|tara:strand:- start:6813 stop:7358 length:546 start_codon:yes stop_codon:yes gene_type:complete
MSDEISAGGKTPAPKAGGAPDYDEERLARLIRLAARSFNRSLQMRLTSEGVTFGQWIFLRILWKSDGLSQRELAERANLTEPTTHTALLRMEEQGFIARRNVGDNKRRVHAFLTERGWELRDVLEPMAVESNDIAVKGLSEVEVKVLRHGLTTIIRNLEQDEKDGAARGLRVPPTRSLAKI